MQDEIGLERERLRNRLLAVRSFFTMFRLKVCGQDRAHTLPHDLVVVRNQNFQLIYDFQVGWTLAGGNVFGYTQNPSRWLSTMRPDS
jgi:hypothetical protein